MKKVIAFAAALLLVASGGSILPRGNYSVAYANRTTDTSSMWANLSSLSSAGYDDGGSGNDILPDSRPDQDSSEPDKPELKLGDLDGDGILNVKDISLMAAYLKGIRTFDDYQYSVGDFNNDGTINVTDIGQMAARVKGIR